MDSQNNVRNVNSIWPLTNPRRANPPIHRWGQRGVISPRRVSPPIHRWGRRAAKPRFLPWISCIGLAILVSPLHSQSPWTRSKGGAFGQLATFFIPKYDRIFGENGSELATPGSQKQADLTIQFYGEYGLSKKTTAVFSLPFKRILPGIGQPASGPGNVQLAVRQSFIKRTWDVGGQFRLDLPSAQRGLNRQIGFRAFTILPTISIGRGFEKSWIFGFGGAGFRTRQFSHFWTAGLEAGHRFQNFSLIAATEINRSFANGSTEISIAKNPSAFFVNDQEFWSIGLKTAWAFNQFVGLNASFFGAIDAQFLPKSPLLGLGIWAKWD